MIACVDYGSENVSFDDIVMIVVVVIVALHNSIALRMLRIFGHVFQSERSSGLVTAIVTMYKYTLLLGYEVASHRSPASRTKICFFIAETQKPSFVNGNQLQSDAFLEGALRFVQ